MISAYFNKRIFLIIIFLTTLTSIYSAEGSLEIYSPNYFNEQNKVYDEIHFLDNEHLSFKFCTDERSKNINFTIMCNTIPKKLDKNIDYQKKGCYFSNYDLDTLPCNEFTLEIDYELDNKNKNLIRYFKKQKQSLLINHVLEKDSQKLKPKDLSYYLIVLNEVQDKSNRENTEIYDKLKNLRDNDEKCWPNNDCDMETTTTVIKNLLFSGYELESRMIEDGKIYIEKNTLSNKNNPLDFELILDTNIGSDEEIECNVTIDEDKEDIEKYRFDEEDFENDKSIIDDRAEKKIEIICSKEIDDMTFKLYNMDDSLQINEEYEDKKEFIYEIEEFTCIGDSHCNYYPTINSLITYSSQLENSGKINKYVDTLIKKEDNEAYIDYEDKIIDTSKFLYYERDNDFISYLRFNQNNDGSWGDSSYYKDKIIQTSWAILGLQKSQGDSEYIKDGKKWVYYNEPYNGWGDIEKNTMAYLAIKENLKPYIKINTENTIVNTTEFEIENPTIYNLKDIKIEFSANINEYLSYTQNFAELSGQEKLKFNVSVSNNLYGSKTGKITITGIDGKNQKIELINIPINLKGKELITIEQKTKALFDKETLVNFEIISKQDNFSYNCEYINPFTNNKVSTKISNQINTISIENPNQKTGLFDLNIDCEDKNTAFYLNTEINLTKTNKTLEVQDSILIDSDSDFSLKVSNLNPDKQTIQISIDGDAAKIISPSENDKILAKNETRDIYFTITDKTSLKLLENSSNSYIILNGEDGFSKEIPIRVRIQEGEESSSNILWYIIGGVVGAFIILVIVRYNQLKKIEKEDNKKNSENQDDMILDDLNFEN